MQAACYLDTSFSVTDTGIGIDSAAQRRIFNPFEQADARAASQRDGTGLDLSISFRLVQIMGGNLEVYGLPGRGSAFYFTLSFDYAAEVSDTRMEIDSATSQKDFQGRNILLAEDNELNRGIAQTIQEMYVFTVTCASNGQEAVDLFCAGEPKQFDAILMDIRMPVMDGLEATHRIRPDRCARHTHHRPFWQCIRRGLQKIHGQRYEWSPFQTD